MLRKTIVAGNWKMHHGPEETRDFFRRFSPDLPTSDPPEVLIFPPALSFAAAKDALDAASEIRLGVQNVHWEEQGAFTGEISCGMAAAAGATHVLIGHSERRHVFGETDEMVAKKAEAALSHGLTPVVCVGETLEERKAGGLTAVILGQLDAALVVLAEADAEFVIAYEPVWAIGTGETATPADASEAHGILRARLAERIAHRADEVPILYGGSVKPANVGDLLAAEDVNGVLVGGASLDPDSFARIAESA